ncbi:MAG: UvrABC system protein A [bacterium]|nr:MAG: UvrABC system protein A [bacterium]
MKRKIKIVGASEHNLKSVSVEIPKEALTVITGPSGSGKSSLAFDVLYAEGQRKYLESLSSYARQFLGKIKKPNVEKIEGLSPSIAIKQQTVSNNPRSIVGTVTEIYDYLRMLYARTATAHCYNCGQPLSSLSIDEMISQIDKTIGLNERFTISSPIIRNKKGQFKETFSRLQKDGYLRVNVDGKMMKLEDEIVLDKNKRHDISVIIDRMIMKKDIRSRLANSLQNALALSGAIASIESEDSSFTLSNQLACPYCLISYPKITPQLFSFNGPQGACTECGGLGVRYQLDINRFVKDPSLSLREGAIPLIFRNPFSAARKTLRRAAEFYNIDLYKPFSRLTEKERQILLYGVPQQTKTDQLNFSGLITIVGKIYGRTESYELKRDIDNYMIELPCKSCDGKRLAKVPLSFTINGCSIIEASSMEIDRFYSFICETEQSLSGTAAKISAPIIKGIKDRTKFLMESGLYYITLMRKSSTLSGGESQRIRLATQIGSGLSDVIYVLDEPSIGLHPSDTEKLIKSLRELVGLRNSVIVVEHDEQIIRSADYLIDLGPGSGRYGGEITAKGTPEQIEKNPKSLTGKYLAGLLKMPQKIGARTSKKFVTLYKTCTHNLKDLTIAFPLGEIVCITGVSGSGKSSLIFDTLLPAAEFAFYGRQIPIQTKYDKITGIDNIGGIMSVDQTPIGRTSRSNPATYTGVLTDIRELLSQTEVAKRWGWKSSRFSFNVPGGRCEHCKGTGTIKIEMQFMSDVYVTCEICGGLRFNKETLKVKFKDKTIADILNMTIIQAADFFPNIPSVKRKLDILEEIGLGYLRLGQPATTLSGGESQRLKLSRELVRRNGSNTLYLLDEPTVGLHKSDISKLIKLLDRLVDKGNSVIIIEHNTDIMMHSDYIIDLGPEGGNRGGSVIAMGTVDDIMKSNGSTGIFLRHCVN